MFATSRGIMGRDSCRTGGGGATRCLPSLRNRSKRGQVKESGSAFLTQNVSSWLSTSGDKLRLSDPLRIF